MAPRMTKAERAQREVAEARARATREARADSITRDRYLIADFLDWLVWLGEQPEGGQVRAFRVAQFYEDYVGRGIYPTEIEARLALPHWPGWD